MAEYPLVYLIILTWNARSMVLNCLDSVATLTYPHLRVVVVDNGSKDGTVEAIRAAWDDQVEVIASRENLRYARGNNVGIRRALSQGADYILLMNNDVVVDPVLVDELVRVAEADPQIGVAGPKIYYFDPPDQLWSAGGEISFVQGRFKHRGIRQQDRGQFDEVCTVDYITGCALMIKRAVVERIGLLDPSYFLYAEDTDWCYRARLAGYRCVYVPRARMWHKISASTGGQFTLYKIYHRLRSDLIFLWRYARPVHWLTIPFGLLADALRVSGLVLAGRFKARG